MERLEGSHLLHLPLPQDDADQLYRLYPDLPKNPRMGCPSCGKNLGEYVDGEVVLDGVKWQCNCADQLQRHKHYLNAGIGLTYQVLDWKDWHGDPTAIQGVMNWIRDSKSNLEMGQGFLFRGAGLGTGKTFCAALILKGCVIAGAHCYMTTFADMLASMKAGWKDEEYNRWYKEKIDSAQVLLIDDLGKEQLGGGGFNNEFAQQTLDSLIRTRVQQGRTTFITSNLSGDEMGQIYGAPLMSLLSERCPIVEFTGSDYRPMAKMSPKGERRIY